MKKKATFCLGILVLIFTIAGFKSADKASAQMKPGKTMKSRDPAGGVSYFDTHNHLSGHTMRGTDYDGALRAALAKMQQLRIRKIFIMPPPLSPDHPVSFDIDDFLPMVREYSDKIEFLGGGGTLNVMIHKAKDSNSVSPELQKKFKVQAEEIVAKGAIGFGEFAIEHFSLNNDHPYESVKGDHPLFLLLADIAADNNMPIDIHMEAIPKDMSLPNRQILTKSGLNPKRIRENISSFEKLLAHNRNAKIIWAHVGWCNTGYRTTTLCRKLLEKHPNLYMSFKLAPDSVAETHPVDRTTRAIKPEWIDLIENFPDRFVVGTDEFYYGPGGRKIGPQKPEAIRRFIDLLPPEAAYQVGIKNPVRIFNLGR